MGKLQINGDLLLAGNLMMLPSNVSAQSVISVKPDSNGYGQNLIIGAGGNTVIGGGESASAFFAASGIKDEENLYLTADGSIHVYTNCDTIANRKLVMSLNADGTINLPNSKIDTDGTFSGRAAGLYRMNHFTTEEQVDSFQAPNTLQYCTIGAEYTPIGNDGVLISAGWSSGRYGAQIWIDDGGGSGGMKIRSFGAGNGAKWNEWQTILTSGNYNSYAPSLTGTGASGNWNISVKNLYYAQKLSTAELLDGFNEASRFKAGYWTDSLVPGCENGIILNMGWTSATYGAQLAIDDDPTYFIALRQKNGSGWADWKRIPMGDGTGASGTWGISITGNASYASSAGHATYLNTTAGNEIRIHNATGLTAGGALWLGWAWADGNKTVTQDWYIGNFSGGGLANVYASTFNGTLNGNASSANWASGASYSNGLASTGFGDNNFTYFQTSDDFYGTTGWAHYLIANHGNGATYYNYVLRLPFGGPPQYKRQTGETSATQGWYTFLSTENYSSYALPLYGGTMTGTIITPGNDSVVIKPAKHNYDQIGASDCKFWKIHASTFYGNLSGNADTATKLATARTISLTGSVTGSGSFDGSGNLSIATTTNHTHNYLPLSGGTLTGNLTLTETKNILLRPNASDYTAGIGYDTNGNECIALWAKNSVTRLRWYAGRDMTNMASGTMMGITPDFEISKASGTAIGYIGGNTILHSNNYTSYTVTKTGSGASGTWGINVTGSAGSVAWGNVTSKPSTFPPSSHTHDYLPLSGGTMSGTIITPGNDSVVIKPAKNNYDQVGGSGAKFWKMFAMYGFFDTVVTTHYGSDAPTRTDLPSGSIYFRTIN